MGALILGEGLEPERNWVFDKAGQGYISGAIHALARARGGLGVEASALPDSHKMARKTRCTGTGIVYGNDGPAVLSRSSRRGPTTAAPPFDTRRMSARMMIRPDSP